MHYKDTENTVATTLHASQLLFWEKQASKNYHTNYLSLMYKLFFMDKNLTNRFIDRVEFMVILWNFLHLYALNNQVTIAIPTALRLNPTDPAAWACLNWSIRSFSDMPNG